MGQNARPESFSARGFFSRAHSAIPRGRSARKLFLCAQALQAIEKFDSARENPRKSKSKTRPSKARFGADTRLGPKIQMAGFAVASNVFTMFSLDAGGGKKISPVSSRNPLKRHDRRPKTAENGGKRRPLSAGFRAVLAPPEPAKPVKRPERAKRTPYGWTGGRRRAGRAEARADFEP
jgi:hypothetical protein